jgi:hypothetical protein
VTDIIDAILLNFAYAIMGGVLTSAFMWLGCKLFNRTVSFKIADHASAGSPNTCPGCEPPTLE